MLNLIGPIAGALFKTVDKVIDNKGEADKIKQDIQQRIIAGELKELEGLMVAHWFGYTAPNIPESVQNSLLNIIMIGIGGYTVGRSGEKIAEKFKKN